MLANLNNLPSLKQTNDFAHGKKNQTAYEAKVMPSSMNFPEHMENFRGPLNKAAHYVVCTCFRIF